MSEIKRTIELIHDVHAQIGTAELARRSGVPYTTLRDCVARNFTGPAVETLAKLEIAARANKSEAA
jgi:hypothetical protein